MVSGTPQSSTIFSASGSQKALNSVGVMISLLR